LIAALFFAGSTVDVDDLLRDAVDGARHEQELRLQLQPAAPSGPSAS
jgi:hypothetical protein